MADYFCWCSNWGKYDRRIIGILTARRGSVQEWTCEMLGRGCYWPCSDFAEIRGKKTGVLTNHAEMEQRCQAVTCMFSALSDESAGFSGLHRHIEEKYCRSQSLFAGTYGIISKKLARKTQAEQQHCHVVLLIPTAGPSTSRCVNLQFSDG